MYTRVRFFSIKTWSKLSRWFSVCVVGAVHGCSRSQVNLCTCLICYVAWSVRGWRAYYKPYAVGIGSVLRTPLRIRYSSSIRKQPPASLGRPTHFVTRHRLPVVGALLAGQFDAEVLGYPYSVSDGLSLSVLETPQGFPNRSWRATLQERAWRRPQKQHVFHPGHA